VRPFFGRLLERDPTGRSWFSTILKAAPHARRLPAELIGDPGDLLPELVVPRPYLDRVLGHTVQLPACFERSARPPVAFLRWLIENPACLCWPERRPGKRITYGGQTQQLRLNLVEPADLGTRDQTIAAAVAELASQGPGGSRRKWWAFEGFTEVDCWLETDRLVLFVEGKRKESLSPATDWFPARNQLVRNLEVVRDVAGDKAAAVLLVTEAPITELTDHVIRAGTPHLDAQARRALLEHYLGQTTWHQLCNCLRVPFVDLPETIDDLLRA
jgi:hypothetical protein